MMIKMTVKLIMMLVLVCVITFNAASAFACGEYTVFIYKVTKAENGEYWGTGVYDESRVYFTQEFIPQGEEINVDDVVIAYFDPKNVVDGLVMVEKVEGVGIDKDDH
ncbi:hypothetical protein [Brevibacillus sp. NRS-1366]|uniref:hypothetical protein n=1 Tax=Brevibacillus sp. NRS-1366 TaxID=3233899 RepID=UPI003D1D2AB8